MTLVFCTYLCFLCLLVFYSHVNGTSRQIKGCFLITSKVNKFCLLLPPWWEDLRGMKSTTTVRLIRAQPAFSLQQRSEGAETFTVTPAKQRRRYIFLSLVWGFLFFYLHQFTSFLHPPDSKVWGCTVYQLKSLFCPLRGCWEFRSKYLQIRGREAISRAKWPRRIPVAITATPKPLTNTTYTCLHSVTVHFWHLSPLWHLQTKLAGSSVMLTAKIFACGQKYLNVPLL